MSVEEGRCAMHAVFWFLPYEQTEFSISDLTSSRLCVTGVELQDERFKFYVYMAGVTLGT
jgi:hypothetical protein